MKRPKKVLLVDLPTYDPHRNYSDVESDLRELYAFKIPLVTALWETRTGIKLKRPSNYYSRGLLSIAACLEKQGFEVQYLSYAQPGGPQQFSRAVMNSDVMGITAMTPTFLDAKYLCYRAKEIKPEIVTVLGGPHINALPEASLRECPEADFVMVGECDWRLGRLLGSLETPESVAGVYYRDQKEIIHSSRMPLEPVDVRELPMPAYHLLGDLRPYMHNIRTARGCPGACSFCCEAGSYHGQGSIHTTAQILGELKFLREHGVDAGSLIHFSDSSVLMHRSRIVKLLKAAGDLGFYYSGDARADNIVSTDGNDLREMRKAGFVWYRIGFESAIPEVLADTQKRMTHEEQVAACAKIRDADPRAAIMAYMVTGLPGSNPENLATQLGTIRNLIRTETVDTVGNKTFVPYPGTPCYQNGAKYGLTLRRWPDSSWNKFDRVSVPVFDLDGMGAEQIQQAFFMAEEAVMLETAAKLCQLGIHKVPLQGNGYWSKHYAAGNKAGQYLCI